MNLFLIRHTKVNVEPRICYGQTDVDVAHTFYEEAQIVKQHVKDIRFCKVYSSPLKRCQKLSEYVFQGDITFDNRLMELNFGSWEMQEWDKITDSEFYKWMNDYIETPCLNGESFLDLHNRTADFIEELKKQDFKNVAIVAHGGSIRSIILNITKKDLKDAFKMKVDFGEVIQITL